ncbi:MAG TPA: hypothetical protein VMT24_17755 [Aggregatilineaceae bacterium]|nr:hypothetical protein [Aggregatilineaceae bacterium]
MKKLLEQFLEMSQHTAVVEDRIAAIRPDNQEELPKQTCARADSLAHTVA